MNYSLGYTLGRSMVFSRGDADALAYIAAVEGTGTSVSSTQKTAINDFYVAAKADSYYTSLKRLYLPIWASAAANAIDMIGLTSGTFNGGVTHAAGYVQGNGTTGYLVDTVNATAHVTLDNVFIGSLLKTNHGGAFDASIGVGTGGTSIILNSSATAATSLAGSAVGGTGQIDVGVASNSGISSIAFNGTTRRLKLRRTAGNTLLGSNAIASGTVPAVQFAILARQASLGVFSLHSSAEVGAAFISLDNGDTLNDAFTLALQNLWQDTTGLTLP